MIRVASGVVKCGRKPLPERLALIFSELCQVCKDHQPTEGAIEGVFFQRNAQSALVLGHARGVAIVALQQTKIPIAEYAPTEIKKALTGTGRAEKVQVKRMVSMMLQRYEPASLDESDALAIAICHLNRPTDLPKKFR
ncbi:MAG: crossover junction endodeoxyribonuclease RuvC [Bradymonadia bacterium]|jgi:crossover junction endodeoxyribonuclease RuvC